MGGERGTVFGAPTKRTAFGRISSSPERDPPRIRPLRPITVKLAFHYDN
jgi:hypothetical protein